MKENKENEFRAKYGMEKSEDLTFDVYKALYVTHGYHPSELQKDMANDFLMIGNGIINDRCMTILAEYSFWTNPRNFHKPDTK